MVLKQRMQQHMENTAGNGKPSKFKKDSAEERNISPMSTGQLYRISTV